MNNPCPVHGSDSFRNTPSGGPFAHFCLCFEFLEPAENWQPNKTEDSVSTQQQPNVLGSFSSIEGLVIPSATTSDHWQGSRYPGHASDPFRHSEGPFAHFEFAEADEYRQPDNTEGCISQQQPSVPGPSPSIEDTITPLATRDQWQGSRYQGHASDPFRHSEGFFAHFEFAEAVEDRQPGKIEDSVYQPQPNVPGPSSAIWRPIVPSVITTNNQWPCSVCPESFPRRQERDRHELAHLPFYLHCPVSGCKWRGNRPGSFKRHWEQKDRGHLSHREQYCRTPGRSQIETFNPKEILDQIKNRAISLTQGQNDAIFMVQVKGYELDKPDMMTHPWGRCRRH